MHTFATLAAAVPAALAASGFLLAVTHDGCNRRLCALLRARRP